MPKQKLRAIIAGLALLNLLTIVIFVIKPLIISKSVIGEETVAKIGSTDISREAWINELEKRYGEDVLEEMVDKEVVKQAAEKYKVKTSDEEVDRELKMMKTMYGTAGQTLNKSTDQLRQEIQSSLLLEKLLTKDVSVSETAMQKYYDDNKDIYRIPTTYHISHITSSTKKQADQIINELEKGVSFAVLAMEKSLDEFTANQGGDLGYISQDNEQVSKEYITAAEKLKVNKWSGPVETDEGWAVLYLHEKIEGNQYTYDEVKDQIHRQIALEQIQSPVSGKIFWDELDVEWFYGLKEQK
ncbi:MULTISPECIES: peptidyl-prolyl cis-trans isomerase [Peribacillus]|uniref:peptidylprolyl isomerase n=1 Tax=Peribacillus butanolivorans TaxID=421767 RepID=A0AAX0RVP7_9BACI|nr:MULTISPECIES: peptidyl-prolyl cis-trans isomerase [Peribacillus]AXN39082.1 peptidylprolyl isomerase [Peribacillus butanolivorans]MBK5485730.1 peptidyl-prolyl cis-trans isomerase [Peribacillus sp. TH16]PEJ26855.1 peptidylprolyl isomerase [Peribacillus butanolivorans]QNU06917.1 peptidylprolyl isomerase [Peribacillus butanolivorans]